MISKHQKFEVKTIHRSAIKNAPYNPRTINDYQRKGLKRNLKKVGFLQPIVWNEATGNIVSGHQRISILDELEKSEDYELSVSAVNLSDKEEMEQNVFLNATTFTGEFDLGALKTLIDGGLDYEAAGLDLYDLNIIGVETGIENEDEDESEHEPPNIDNLRAEKERARDAIDKRADEGESYVSLSFNDYKAKAAWMRSWGFNPDDLFVKGEVFQKMVEKKLEEK
jgi:ParB-like chromosome segregation protein Spo0J